MLVIIMYYVSPFIMYGNNINDITSKSCGQRLITKEHIAVHTKLKPASYSSTLVTNILKLVRIKLF